MPAVEGEFAFRLSKALPPRSEAYHRGEVASAIGAIAGAIEVVGTRFAGGLLGKGRLLTTADGGVNIALVLGPWFSDWRRWDVPRHAVSMTVNGEMKGQGTGARALGDPMNVLIWLANQQSRLGRGLDAGAGPPRRPPVPFERNQAGRARRGSGGIPLGPLGG
jgi:2-keto-4-pentenoate hydratase